MTQLEPALEILLDRAWKVRQAFFSNHIEFAAPNRTIAVSVTGGNCALKCAHCNGTYLQQMMPL